jgi:sec-independent protein translocase protein TatA
MFRGLFQLMHLLVILGIVLIIIGPGRLPELGSSLSKAIRVFKSSVSETENKSDNLTMSEHGEKHQAMKRFSTAGSEVIIR